ncbi:MAG: HEPN domain-containing protein [Magnetospirillum sp.]|nr:HEPN domain-containing protein [Magnetospirillum sp.]
MSDPDQRQRQWSEAGQWFIKADEDICMAEMALVRQPPLIDPAAFHCQQAAEKILKGLLVAAAVRAPRSHDIEILSSLAAPLYPGLASRMDQFALVSTWTMASRYPDYGGGLGTEANEVADMLKAITAFRTDVAALSPIQLPRPM